MQQPIEHYIDVNDANLCWFEWGTPNDQATILLVHATGFHARCWDQVVSRLGNRHIIAIDQRGHGRSSKAGPVEWDVYAQDLVLFIEAMNLTNITLVGHSMGGYCVARSLVTVENRVRSALLIDPVIFDPQLYAKSSLHASFADTPDQHPVARRRNHFLDAQAMYDNFDGRGSYASWLPEALHDYCQFGLLVDEENGGYKLACPPHIEASIYMGSQGQPISELLGDIATPVTVLRAEQRVGENTTLDFTKSPTWSELASQFKNGTDVYLPQLTHFMPMQAPDLVAEYILESYFEQR